MIITRIFTIFCKISQYYMVVAISLKFILHMKHLVTCFGFISKFNYHEKRWIRPAHCKMAPHRYQWWVFEEQKWRLQPLVQGHIQEQLRNTRLPAMLVPSPQPTDNMTVMWFNCGYYVNMYHRVVQIDFWSQTCNSLASKLIWILLTRRKCLTG